MKLKQEQINIFKEVIEIFKGVPIYLVGGAVRDIVRGDKPKDYDFCIGINPDEIEKRIRNSGRKAYLMGKRFGTIACKVNGAMIEITTFREEKYSRGNRKPEVNFVSDITKDLSRRDFTINAMAIRLDNMKLIDPFGGTDDMKNGIIKCVGTAKTRFAEDPLRILRAIRFASRYGFIYEEKTEDKIKKMASRLLDISKERWVMELDKILINDYIYKALIDLWKFRIFNYIIPELSLQNNYKQNSQYHNLTLNEHTARVVESCPKDVELRWAALLHDIAKPFVRTENKRGYSNYIGHEILGKEISEKICNYLKFSKNRRKYIVNMVRNHLEDDCELREYDNIGKSLITKK